MEVSPNDLLANRSVGLKAAVCPNRSGWMSRGMLFDSRESAGMILCLNDSYRGISLEDDDEEDDEELEDECEDEDDDEELLEDDDDELDDEDDECEDDDDDECDEELDDEELDDEEDELDELDEDDEDGGLYGSHAHTALLTLVHLCAK